MVRGCTHVRTVDPVFESATAQQTSNLMYPRKNLCLVLPIMRRNQQLSSAVINVRFEAGAKYCALSVSWHVFLLIWHVVAMIKSPRAQS